MNALELFLQPWSEIESHFEAISALRDCPQDPIYHAEGDVYVHTQHVLSELEKLPEWQALEPRARAIVRAGALFHDIGKPAKTIRSDEGRVSSRNHSLRGAQMVRSMLYRDYPLEMQDREAIANLVLLHGLPATFLNKPDPQRSVIRASLAVSCDWLSIVATADALGRVFTEETGDRLEHVKLFRSFCAENACLRSPRAFPSDFSRFQYFQGRDCLEYPAFDDSVCDVIVMSGLPAAGKDTVVRNRYADRPAISMDALRAKAEIDPEDDQGEIAAKAKELARGYLRDKRAFVWNATNISRQLRLGLLELFNNYKARVRIVYVEAPYADVLARNKQRKHPVPTRVIDGLVERLELPQLDEACTVEYLANVQVR